MFIYEKDISNVMVKNTVTSEMFNNLINGIKSICASPEFQAKFAEG